MRKNPRTVVLLGGLGLLLSATVFAAGFALAYLQDRENAEETARLAYAHMRYARELKDDMAFIDWGNDLKKLRCVAEFKVAAGGKVLLQGGNQALVPAGPLPEGCTFLFPTTWAIHWPSPTGNPDGEEFTLLLEPWPGPLAWGFLGLSAAWLGGGLVFGWFLRERVRLQETSELPNAAPKSQSEPSSFPLQKLGPLAPYANKPCLFVDAGLVIQAVSPSASRLLGLKEPQGKGTHLMDLHPAPFILEAMNHPTADKLSTPFPLHPELSLTIQKVPEGSILILEEAVQG